MTPEKELHYISCINWLRGALCNLNNGWPEVAKASIDQAIVELRLARDDRKTNPESKLEN